MLGKSCAGFLGADDALTSLATVFEGTAIEFESRRRDRWLRHQVEPLRGADGRVIGAVGVSLDITEIKDTQRRLEAMARRDALTGLPNRLALEELLSTTSGLTGRERAIAEPLLRSVVSRLGFLIDVGLDYLTLDRSAQTLSGDQRALMRRHFRITSRYEWMFWDMGYRRESWPV